MKAWIAFWNILRKDMRTYYLKPPNLSWGIIFPLAIDFLVLLLFCAALFAVSLANMRRRWVL
jgi:hypothetical protein